MSHDDSSSQTTTEKDRENKLEKYVKMWDNLRDEIADKKERMDLIKNKICKMMEGKNLSKLNVGKFRIVRRTMTRETIAKKNCPSEVWKQYCKKSSYPVIALYNGREKEVSDEFEDI